MVIQKITTGYVVQKFDTETQKWDSQEFVTGDYVVYETENGNDIEESKFEELTNGNDYLPFNMEQPF
jgi:hypothetical protein